MALIGSHSAFNKSAGSFSNGTSTAGAYSGKTRSNFDKPGKWRNAQVVFGQKAAYPNGANPPYSYLMAQKSGGLVAYRVSGAADLTGTLASGVNLDSALSGSGNITTATLALIANLSASLTATGTITDAQLAIIASLTASISASGTVTTADLGNILNLAAAVSATGTLSTADLVTIKYLTADISTVTELSPEGLSASLLDNNDIETGYSMREALRLILSSVAGKLSGADTTTITIRNVPDSKNRIVATVDSNGNRSAVTYDVSD